MKLNQVSLVVLLFAASGVVAAAAKLDKVQTRYGKFEVRSGKPDSPPDAIFVNGSWSIERRTSISACMGHTRW